MCIVTVFLPCDEIAVFEAIRLIDTLGGTRAERQAAIDTLIAEAQAQPLICVEMARRFGSGTEASAFLRAFDDSGHACNQNIVAIIKTLHGTGNDEPVFYGFLSQKDLLDNQDFVNEVLNDWAEISAQTLARRIRTLGLSELAKPIARSVTGRFRAPGQWESVRDGWEFPWEMVYGDILLDLRTDSNRQAVDEALQHRASSMRKPEFEEQAKAIIPEEEIKAFMKRIDGVVGANAH